MNKITQEILAIEEIRRRAKDNKTKIAEIFVKTSEDYLEKTRNILFLISFSIIGYFGATQNSLSCPESVILTISIVFGLISYYYSFLHSLAQVNFYSALEKNLSQAFPNQKEYEAMLTNEENIRTNHSDRNKHQVKTIIAIIIQAILLAVTLLLIFN